MKHKYVQTCIKLKRCRARNFHDITPSPSFRNLASKMSDVENRPPTSVLSSKSGLKDGITKPKDKTVKPKVTNASKKSSCC